MGKHLIKDLPALGFSLVDSHLKYLDIGLPSLKFLPYESSTHLLLKILIKRSSACLNKRGQNYFFNICEKRLSKVK